jgi:uncharacterized protein YcsI (UPF0317 family)
VKHPKAEERMQTTAEMPATVRKPSAGEAAQGVAAAHELCARIRAGVFDDVTAGLAPGMVQANLMILPAAWATDFKRFCDLNPKPCPLLGMTAPGDPMLPELGEDIDLRTDLPRYNVYRDGALAEEVTDLTDLWQGDFVGFALGCSFSFEEALLKAGLPLRHQEEGMCVPMYKTGIETAAAGPFSGPLVVSMRPFSPADAVRAVEITSHCDRVHGAPVHVGDAAAIGIADIDRPSWEPPVPMRPGEVPVFWACGVTPQAVVERARPPIAISHKPGHMLVTDLLNADLAT